MTDWLIDLSLSFLILTTKRRHRRNWPVEDQLPLDQVERRQLMPEVYPNVRMFLGSCIGKIADYFVSRKTMRSGHTFEP